MKTATISDAKNRLSAYLDYVKAGETVMITDRGVPVARLEPVSTAADPSGRRERLVRAGLMRIGSAPLSPSVLADPTTDLPAGVSLVDAVLDERRAGW